MNMINPYIVKSKTGKMHYFDSECDAFNFAEKGNKTVYYTVYKEGKSIACFFNGKRIDSNWTPVFEEKVEFPGEYVYLGGLVWCDEEQSWKKDKIPCKNPSYFKNGLTYDLVKRQIDTCEDKIRIRHMYRKMYVKDGKRYSSVCSKSVTFHSNGRVCGFMYGKIHQPYFVLLDCTPEELGVLKTYLSKFAWQVNTNNIEDLNDIIGSFMNPNKYFIVDTFKRTLEHRKLMIPSMFTFKQKEVLDENKYIEAICKKAGIPCTKVLKNIYYKNPVTMIYVKAFMEAGIKNIDSLNKLANLGTYSLEYDLESKDRCLIKFLNALIYYKGENWLVDQIYRGEFEECADSARMLHIEIRKEILEFILKNSRNISEIHDTISYYYNNNYINKTIQYTEKEVARFNHKYGLIRFELAIDSKDLAIVGAEMGICVGGYANDAVAKRTTIVKMIDNGKYVGCIEVQNNQLVQMKSKFNNPIKACYKEIIDMWIKETSLEICTNDYYRIGEPWTSSYRYDNVRPEIYEHHNDNQLKIVRTALRLNYRAQKEEAEKENEKRRKEAEKLWKKALDEYEQACQEELNAWVAEMAEQYN